MVSVKFVAGLVLVLIICVAIHQKDNIIPFFEQVFHNTCSMSASFAANLMEKDSCCRYGYNKWCDGTVHILEEITCAPYLADQSYWKRKCL